MSADAISAQEVSRLVREYALGLQNIGELVGAVADATCGYRATLEAKGFSPTMAEQMAAEYHTVLMGQLAMAVTPGA